MYLCFKYSPIAAVALAGASNGGEPGSGRRARRAWNEDETVGFLAVGALPLKADRDPRALQDAAAVPTCMVNGNETAFVDCTEAGADCKQACLTACDGKENCSCCVGGERSGTFQEACDGFQGKVCPDGSCSGPYACRNANIGYVVDGCRGGVEACSSAANNGGYLGSVVSSCKDEMACNSVASRGGEIQEISSSCNNFWACWSAAMWGGEIQKISSSCNNVQACRQFATGSQSTSGGSIQEISSSCNAKWACIFAAHNGGSIQEITSSCNEVEACRNAAQGGGIIPNKMEHCCNTQSACYDLAKDGQEDPEPDQCYTEAPTGAPTSTVPEATDEHAWYAAPEGIDSDFSTPDGAAVNSTFTVGKGGAEVVVEAALFERDCETEAAGGVLELAEANPRRRPKNGTHDTVIVQVGINKTGLGSSPFWDPVASVISYCEKLRLKTNSSLLTSQLVVTELVKLVNVFVDGNATFSLGANLTGLASDFVNRTIDLAGSLKAFRCRGTSFLPSAGSLSPNDLLNICLQPKTDGVEVSSVDRVTLDQDGSGLDIVAGGNIKLPSITSREYVPGERGWLVSSRVPANVITFAAGRTLKVSGSVRMGLVGGAADARRLQQVPAAGSDDREEEAFFDVEVDLVGEEAVDGVAALSPAASVKAKGATAAAAISVAFALVFFMG